MNNNDDVFLKQMKGVSPIKKNNRIKKEKPKTNYKSGKRNIVKNKDTWVFEKPENSNGPAWTLIST